MPPDAPAPRNRGKVWFHRSRAILWAIVGALSFPMGWANSVTLVWVASLYANVATDWGSAEAADDRQVLQRLDEILERLDRLEQIAESLTTARPGP